MRRRTPRSIDSVCVLAAALFFSHPGNADSAPPSSTPFYKITSDSSILLQPPTNSPITDAIVEDLTPCATEDTAKPKYACAHDEISNAKPAYSLIRADIAKTSHAHGFYELIFPAGTLKLKRIYRLTYRQSDPATHNSTAATLTIDTSPAVTVSYLPRATAGYLFEFESVLAFRNSSGLLVTSPTDCPSNPQKSAPDSPWKPVTLTATDKKLGKTQAVQVWLKAPAQASANPFQNPNGLGSMYVCVNRTALHGDFALDPAGAPALLANIDSALGSVPWTLAPGSKLAPAPPPTAKGDASFYANVNLAAATGASFAWGLDGKIALLPLPLAGGTLTLLSAAANTGHNTASVKGQTYTDTIDWTLPYTYLFSIPGSSPATLVVTASPLYETDLEFDRRNLLIAADTTWSLKKLYQPQTYRTPAKNGQLVKYPDPSLSPFGYGLQLHAGIEAGGALIDTIQKATSGSAKQTIPTYSIARAVPQVRGFLQWIPNRSLGLLTLDDTFTGRYLFATENTVEQSRTFALRLRPIDGWKGFNSFLATWSPPSTGHFGLTATYNDGFCAPRFSRVNSVTLGVTILY
jgi:hypothetical protein